MHTESRVTNIYLQLIHNPLWTKNIDKAKDVVYLFLFSSCLFYHSGPYPLWASIGRPNWMVYEWGWLVPCRHTPTALNKDQSTEGVEYKCSAYSPPASCKLDASQTGMSARHQTRDTHSPPHSGEPCTILCHMKDEMIAFKANC